MFAGERQAGNRHFSVPENFHFIYSDYLLKTDMPEHQFKVRVFQFSATGTGNYQLLYPVPQRQQGFQQYMILMIVRDKYIIDAIGKVCIRKMFHVGMISVIADQGIYQYAQSHDLYQDTGMTEIAHPDLVA